MSCCELAGASADLMLFERADEPGVEEQRIRLASHEVGEGLLQTEFILPSMHCAACLVTLERGLSALAQVRSVRANLSTRRVKVAWEPAKGSGVAIEKAIGRLGYEGFLDDGEDAAADPVAKQGKELLLCLAVSGFATANIMLLSVSVWSGAEKETAALFHFISGLIAIPAVAYAGRPFFVSALRALAARRLNMDVPISLGVLLALGLSIYETLTGGAEAYFDASVSLIFFLLIGRTLDHAMRARARGAVDRLARLAPKGVIALLADGTRQYIPVSEVVKGQHLLLRPGERLPVDAEVLEGTTDIDRSLVTGESRLVQARPGDFLEAGILNVTGPLKVAARGTADSSFLAEIRRMMEAAENGRSGYVQVAERMSRAYSPVVHLLALLTFAGWMAHSGGDWHQSVTTAIAVLIITCPCALGLAVPVVHVIGANRLFREGIMMRDGSALERIAETTDVVFDKTGTLTSGEPVTRPLGELAGEEIAIMRALAHQSSHPLSLSLADCLGEGKAAAIEFVREVPGYGVSAFWNDVEVRLGRPSWVSEIASAPVANGSFAFAVEGRSATSFEAHDRLRQGAEEAVRTLQEQGLGLHILSGDRREAVAALAGEIGISRWMAEMTPTGKIAAVNGMQSRGDRVLMVGDGLNDAPALAAGHASMAPANASDVGRAASDFVFTRGDLRAVPFARYIAIRAGALVRQNFALAILYNVLAVPFAMAGYVTPLLAALAMSASSIVVVANSMRLYFASRGEKTCAPLQLEEQQA